ncbi:hypothetical protein Golob_010848 [Gossypium lobatum]|uniref:Uncharacterized protein n=1 Tax=Gossypium lobatum TaxID=34289 RepID=A0A7J8MMX3_9ROSI|nr:hypothetical protein [Gossypium lobatum]
MRSVRVLLHPRRIKKIAAERPNFLNLIRVLKTEN